MNFLLRVSALAALVIGPGSAMAAPIHAVLYKNPQCECCNAYAAYLQQNGFVVDVKPTTDLLKINEKAGVPDDLAGCHTMFVNGYVVDGLAPIDAIRKLLTERPKIIGITLPGMPVGAPGMGGSKMAPLTVYAFAKGGKPPTIFAVE